MDRYLSWFGQANAYMIGPLAIDALRAEAKQELGAAFDIKALLDAVLLKGSIPLSVLRDEVRRRLAFA